MSDIPDDTPPDNETMREVKRAKASKEAADTERRAGLEDCCRDRDRFRSACSRADLCEQGTQERQLTAATSCTGLFRRFAYLWRS